MILSDSSPRNCLLERAVSKAKDSNRTLPNCCARKRFSRDDPAEIILLKAVRVGPGYSMSSYP